MTRIVDPDTGELKYRLEKWQGLFVDSNDSDQFRIPCGKCIGCRLDYSRTWADRMMIELDHSKCAIFATLTYDEAHVPMVNGIRSLCKKDLQYFFKRLRSRFPDKEIRFYASGEYGDHTHRPHYHAVIFGLSLSDFPDSVLLGENFAAQSYYNSSYFAEIWSNGNVCLSDVSWSTCAYTARYVTKKVSADYDGKDFNPHKLGIQSEFALMSRRPGIAGFYHLEHPEYYKSMSVFVSNGKDVPGSDGIKRVRIPHYVFDHLSDSDPALFQRLKEERRKFGSDKDLLELSDTDLDLICYNNLKQRKQLEKYDLLKRGDF